MLTRNQALVLGHGTILYHITRKNADGTPARCRVTGCCKVWKTRPTEFKLPVKHGMYDSFYITHENEHEWAISPTAAVVEGS